MPHFLRWQSEWSALRKTQMPNELLTQQTYSFNRCTSDTDTAEVHYIAHIWESIHKKQMDIFCIFWKTTTQIRKYM